MKPRGVVTVAAVIASACLLHARPAVQSGTPADPDIIPIHGEGKMTEEELRLENLRQEQQENDDATWEALRDHDLYTEGDDDGPDPNPPPPQPSNPVPVNPEAQSEDIIPISGESSASQDDIMAPEAGPHLMPAAWVTLARPLITFANLRDGVIEMRIYTDHGLTDADRRRLSAIHRVLRPAAAGVAGRMQARVNAAAPRGSGVHVTRIPLRAYCLEPAKLPAPRDSMFVVGSRATQARYASARQVRLIADLAARRGFLRPQGDPAVYARFVTQYAVWTRLERWNEARFTDEFIRRARQEFAVSRTPWTDESERTLRALAPARWRDVAIVVNASARRGGTQ